MPCTAFADRSAAGQLLAAELDGLADRRPIVFGLPRCGVPVAYEVRNACSSIAAAAGRCHPRAAL